MNTLSPEEELQSLMRPVLYFFKLFISHEFYFIAREKFFRFLEI